MQFKRLKVGIIFQLEALQVVRLELSPKSSATEWQKQEVIFHFVLFLYLSCTKMLKKNEILKGSTLVRNYF